MGFPLYLVVQAIVLTSWIVLGDTTAPQIIAAILSMAASTALVVTEDTPLSERVLDIIWWSKVIFDFVFLYQLTTTMHDDGMYRKLADAAVIGLYTTWYFFAQRRFAKNIRR